MGLADRADAVPQRLELRGTGPFARRRGHARMVGECRLTTTSTMMPHRATLLRDQFVVASTRIHFRSIDGGLTLCGLESPRIANANLPSTPDIALVTCRSCVIQFKHEQRRAQKRAAEGDPLPVTRAPLHLATKADIAELK